MREIKFRAWDKKEKAMRKIARLDLADGSAYTHLFNGIQLDFWNNVILEQFTGLYDKNGVGIYEGDEVRIENQNGEFNNFIIYAYGNTLCLDCGSHCGLDCDIYTLDFLSYGDDYESLEVIGNIHESEDK